MKKSEKRSLARIDMSTCESWTNMSDSYRIKDERNDAEIQNVEHNQNRSCLKEHRRSRLLREVRRNRN